MRKEIFTCGDIKWKELKNLFERVSRASQTHEKGDASLLLELSIIRQHLLSCEICRAEFLALAQRYRIGEGDLPPTEEEKNK